MKIARVLLLLPLIAGCNVRQKAAEVASAVAIPEVASAPVVMAVASPSPVPVMVSAPTTTPQPVIKQGKRAPKVAVSSAASAMAVPLSVADAYQQALTALQQGRMSEAQAYLRKQLASDPLHASSRKLLVTLLLDTNKTLEAEEWLADGVNRQPAQLDMAMLLARLQSERGALPAAQWTLQQSAQYAQQHGAYLAFMGALAQQAGQHEAALGHIDAALKLAPNHGAWLLAQGVSRQALGQTEAAKQSTRQSLQSGQLSEAQKKLARQLLARLH